MKGTFNKLVIDDNNVLLVPKSFLGLSVGMGVLIRWGRMLHLATFIVPVDPGGHLGEEEGDRVSGCCFRPRWSRDRWQHWWEPAPLSGRANSRPLCSTRWRTRRHLPSPPWTHGHKGWPQVDTGRQTSGTQEPHDHSKHRKTRTCPKPRWRKGGYYVSQCRRCMFNLSRQSNQKRVILSNMKDH